MSTAEGSRPVVLVVDDAAMVRAYHHEILSQAGFEVHQAANGYEALEQAVSRPYDLLLVDVNMPVMDGYTCVESVRREAVRPQVPIVMISTEKQDVDARNAYRAGANVYLVKPVDPERLVLTAKLLTGSLQEASP